MSRSDERPLPLKIGDRAVEAMYLLARDIRSSAAMRQQPLFNEVDEPALDAARRGILGIVLRVAFVLHAEGAGILPLGHDAYDRRFGLTPIGEARKAQGAWRRLVRLSELLSAEGRAGQSVVRSWGSALFERAWMHAFESAPRGSSTLDLEPSDRSILGVIRTLGWEGRTALNLGLMAVEQVAGLYERLIGHEIVRCSGTSLRVGRSRAVVNLDALLAAHPAQRADKLARSGLKPSAAVIERVRDAQTLEAMATAFSRRRVASPKQLAAALLPAGTIVLQPSLARRRAGAHYTPVMVARQVVSAALKPLIDEAGQEPERILGLRVCDPAMGTGGFLVESCHQLAEVLADAWRAKGGNEGKGSGEQVLARARFQVASRCLYGLDLDPLSVELARLALRLASVGPEGDLPKVDDRLRCGDALLGVGPWEGRREPSDSSLVDVTWIPGGQAAIRSALKSRCNGSMRSAPTVERVRRLADRYVLGVLEAHGQASPKRALAAFREGLLRVNDAAPVSTPHSTRPFHWPLEFPEVFTGEHSGFDAMVGNPPWVAFAGRAAQPIAKPLWGYFLHVSQAFHGYRTLQGLFVHRGASLLRGGGRMGFVIPTSMADLAGYAPVRRVHDAICDADEDLPDFGGDAFDGVFQPAMALLSTRRSEPRAVGDTGVWILHRDDLEDWALALLERLAKLPAVPAHAFKEFGFQSTREDRPRIQVCSGPQPPFEIALREGTDVRPFQRLPARLFLDPTDVGRRLRPTVQYGQVDVLIRQTARYPIAALADGLAFRNSVLAGFAFDGWPATALVAYLNSWPIRWLHFMRNRDARQGMPQVKIAHLRALPLPRLEGPDSSALEAMGACLGHRNEGITSEEQSKLDILVARILGICSNDLACIERWRIVSGLG